MRTVSGGGRVDEPSAARRLEVNVPETNRACPQLPDIRTGDLDAGLRAATDGLLFARHSKPYA